MTINAAKQILDDFYDEMKSAEDENSEMSAKYLLKVQEAILQDYAMKIIDEGQWS